MAEQRPTDEETARVVAWKYKDEKAYKDFRVEYFEEVRKTVSAVFCDRTIDEKSILFSEDPRDDTDTAIELFWYLMRMYSCNTLPGGGWLINNDVFIPISGQPFRYAVVNFAIKIMENNK